MHFETGGEGVALGVISKVRTSRTNERTFIWHFTPSLPPRTKVWSTMRVMYGRWPCTLSSFFPTTCPNNDVCLMQGRFPEGSASIAKWTRRQSRTVEEICLLTDDDAVNRNVSIRYYKIKIIPPVSQLQTLSFMVRTSLLTMRVISARSFGSLTKKYTIFSFSPFTARSKAGGRSIELERVAVIAY